MSLSIGANARDIDLVGQAIASAKARSQAQNQAVQQTLEANTRRIQDGVQRTIGAMQATDQALVKRGILV